MWSSRKFKEEADHGLVSGTYLHSIQSHFSQIWEAHDETTLKASLHYAFWVYRIKKTFANAPLVAQK